MKALDERRIGLLIRMNYIRRCVCRKTIQLPLLRRGLTRETAQGSYAITPAGRKEAERLTKQYKGKKLVSYAGISIGDFVMILQERGSQGGSHTK